MPFIIKPLDVAEKNRDSTNIASQNRRDYYMPPDHAYVRFGSVESWFWQYTFAQKLLESPAPKDVFRGSPPNVYAVADKNLAFAMGECLESL